MNYITILPAIFRIYLWNSGLEISRNMAYRVNFFLSTIISLIHTCVAPIVQALIFTSTNGYPGWTISELILFQGVLLFWGGLRNMLFGKVFNEMMNLVRKGDFDRLLLKPYPSIFLLLANGFQLNSVAPTLAGITIITIYMIKFNLAISVAAIPLILLVIMAGLLLYVAMLIILCSLTISLVQLGRLWDVFQKVISFSEYPVSIYPKMLRTFFSFIIPFAIWINYPAEILLSRFDYLSVFIAVASCLVLFVLSNLVWKACLGKYTSAGG